MNLRAFSILAIQLGVTAFYACFPITVGANFLKEIDVERFIVRDGALQIETDMMTLTGKFLPVSFDPYTPEYLGLTVADVSMLLGQPLVDADTFYIWEANHMLGPTWIRSRDTFSVPGYSTSLVIVGIKGKIDPDPTITITRQPFDDVELFGHTAVFSCDATPADYIFYQWRFKGKNIPGEVLPVLGIPNVSKTNAGIYTCALTTGFRTFVVTKPALLRVILPVSIKTQPKSQTVNAGKSIVFRVLAQGTGPLLYQWYFNSSPISGATKSFLSVPNVTSAQAGSYSVLVVNTRSSATSDTATLTVTP